MPDLFRKTINSNYAMRGSDVFTIQYTWGTGNTSSKSVNVPISAIKSHMLVYRPEHPSDK